MRLAVISTPRVGNTWVRHLLGTAYQIPHLAKHSLTDREWAELPAEVVLQLHWRREPELVARLADGGFQVLTIARHPFDVLISILHFCVYDSESEQWLLGRGGTEAPIYGAMPRSRSFIAYAKGPRATELLAVTPDWWHQPDVHKVQYEALVQNTQATLRTLEEQLGPFRAALPRVIEQCSFGQLRQGARNNHFWKGQPGLWQQLLPAAEVAELWGSLGSRCEELGYEAIADPTLTAAAADARWIELVGDEVKQTLRRLNETYRQELHAKDAHIADVTSRFLAMEARLNASFVLGGPVGRLLKRLRNTLRRPRPTP